MAVDAHGGIGEDAGPTHLDDLQAVGIYMMDQCLLQGHGHIPVFNNVGAAVGGGLAPDAQHTALLGDVSEGLAQEIGGDIQQQNVIQRQAAALGNTLELLVHLRAAVLEKFQISGHKALIGLHVHLLLLQLAVDRLQIAPDGGGQLLPLLDAPLKGGAGHLAIGVFVL